MLLRRLKAIRRKNDIDLITSEKESLQALLHEALMERYDLTMPQRMSVLASLVEQVKGENDQRLEAAKRDMLEAEHNDDTLRMVKSLGNIYCM